MRPYTAYEGDLVVALPASSKPTQLRAAYRHPTGCSPSPCGEGFQTSPSHSAKSGNPLTIPLCKTSAACIGQVARPTPTRPPLCAAYDLVVLLSASSKAVRPYTAYEGEGDLMVILSTSSKATQPRAMYRSLPSHMPPFSRAMASKRLRSIRQNPAIH